MPDGACRSLVSTEAAPRRSCPQLGCVVPIKLARHSMVGSASDDQADTISESVAGVLSHGWDSPPFGLGCQILSAAALYLRWIFFI